MNRNKKGFPCGNPFHKYNSSDGNYLFFPEGIDCPINGLFISNSSQVNSNYTQIELIKNRYFLIYFSDNIPSLIVHFS